MLAKSRVILGSGMVFLLLACVVFSVSMMTGCTPAAQQTVQISPERQKAIQDSLRKEAEFQINLNYSIGREHQKNQNYKDAIRPFWKVIKLDTLDAQPKFPIVYTFLGESYLKLDMPDSALIAFKLGTERASDKIHNHRMVAFLSAAQGDYDTAIDEYYNTIKIDPDNISDYKQLGSLLVQQERYDEAKEVYLKIQELDPQDADAIATLAQIQRILGEDEYDIIATKIEALNQSPENTQIMSEIASMYFKLAEYENALKYYNMFLEKKPDDVRALEYAGSCYQNMGQYRKAIEIYEKVLAQDPEHKKVMCEMGTCYKELKQFSRARSFANKALAIDSGYGLAFMVRGLVYEATADDCIGKRDKRISKIDDKLVYELAYNEYQKATQDPVFARQARDRMNYIKPEIPTQEDRFMYPNKKKAELDCYSWIY